MSRAVQHIEAVHAVRSAAHGDGAFEEVLRWRGGRRERRRKPLRSPWVARVTIGGVVPVARAVIAPPHAREEEAAIGRGSGSDHQEQHSAAGHFLERSAIHASLSQPCYIIHSYVIMPGRCAWLHGFSKFTEVEANDISILVATSRL